MHEPHVAGGVSKLLIGEEADIRRIVLIEAALTAVEQEEQRSGVTRGEG